MPNVKRLLLHGEHLLLPNLSRLAMHLSRYIPCQTHQAPQNPHTHHASRRKTTHSTAKMMSTAIEPLPGSLRVDHWRPLVLCKGGRSEEAGVLVLQSGNNVARLCFFST